MPSEVQNKGAPILFDVRPLFGILGYSFYRVFQKIIKRVEISQQKFGKVPTLPIESGGEEEITDFDNTLYIS